MFRYLSVFLLLCAPAQARMDEVSYMKNGAYVGKIGTYTMNGSLYLEAASSAKLMGGKIYWYPVSGKLMLQNKGNKILFFMKSDSVMINDTKVALPNPLIVRGGKAFLAMDFFISKHFARAFGFKLEYDAAAGVLAAQQKININSINYYSYKDKTRVVVYLEEALDYQLSQKENNVLSVTVPNGVVEAEEKLTIADGVVTSVDVFQENKMVRLVFTPGDNFGKVVSFKLAGPDRLVLDIEKSAKPIAQSINAPSVPGPDSGGEAEILPPSAPALSTSVPAAEPDVSVPDVNIPDKFVLDKGGRKRIVIDAGHGGKDAGGRKAFGLSEKEINLQIAKELYNILKDEDIFDVLMTRTSDVFIPLNERSEIANNYKADIFISIHANASRDRREKGFELYFMSENASDPLAAEVADYENSVLGLEEDSGASDASAMLLHSLARNEYVNEGSQLAGLISKELEKSTPFANRGVKQAAFYVLRGTYTPGVLVEMGFMTNSKDQKGMNDKKVRAKIANAVYKGVMKYAQMKKWK
ncbi:MAG: N-acetylmuramoyl-L-alanine amidase [Elusimicrobiales bacterium]|jgi:N-acetylmuramoyl-L-alanine amidase